MQRLADSPELAPLCDERHRFDVLRRSPYNVVSQVAHTRRTVSDWQAIDEVSSRLEEEDSKADEPGVL